MEANFEQSLSTHRDALARYAYSLTMDGSRAEDLVQETFYRALKYKEHFKLDSNLKAWLFTIMKNTFINEYRRQSRVSATFDTDVRTYVVNNRKADSNPERDFRVKEVESLINSLDPSFRIPFLMFERGYKYKEISDCLGLCIGTVKSRIHFSRKKLSKLMML